MLSLDLILWGSCKDQMRACIHGAPWCRTVLGTECKRSGTASQEETKEETLTQRQVRVIIKECVEAEDKQAPLTDEQLVAVLKEKGYDIARRTVAKYRQQLGIPVARMRR